MPQIFKVLAMMAAAAKLAAGDPDFKVLDVLFGSDAELEASGVHLIDTPQKWQQLWTTVEGDAVLKVGGRSNAGTTVRPLPTVDFEKNFVLGVFGGTQQDVAGYQVVDASGMGEKAYVRIRPVYRQGRPGVLVHNPYLLVMFPRTKKEVEVQILVALRGPKPEYRTVQTLPKTLKEDPPKGPTGRRIDRE